MRKPIIAGNWKMNKTVQEACILVDALKKGLSDVRDVEIVVCPPFTALRDVGKAINGTNIHLGAQNVYLEEKGPYTGEISPLMLKDLGCKYVIIGHSERRRYFGEDNELINKKVRKSLSCGLSPILCVGERLEERKAGRQEEVVYDHVVNGLTDLSKEDMMQVVIAYEPVWAIGTGVAATPEDAQEMHKFIRNILSSLHDRDLAEGVRIQYGGSVKPENISDLMAKSEIDGVLVGGASLNADSFVKIVRFKRRG
ncbi:MAG: triose-phosphate isomerase [bacterium]|nr:triose-phosphate isomerase [bacterium]